MAQNSGYDERLEHLLANAAQVFARKGFHPTTMRELARATRMSLAGMYHYVRGKDELLFLIQERCFSRVLAGADAAIASARDPLERLERFIAHHVTFFARHMDEMKVLSHEADSLSEARRERINQLKRRYVDLLLDSLRSLPAEQVRVDHRVAGYALFGMMNWIYNWYDPSGPVSPTSLAEQFSTIFLRGVAPAAVPLPGRSPSTLTED